MDAILEALASYGIVPDVDEEGNLIS